MFGSAEGSADAQHRGWSSWDSPCFPFLTQRSHALCESHTSKLHILGTLIQWHSYLSLTIVSHKKSWFPLQVPVTQDFQCFTNFLSIFLTVPQS